ncbi:hypothetical protein [Streptomyces sp. LN500]|uniref:hypothetical protein n=1 Tax=Streptomyces sp. LN500 TaxID=3112978 RepID=UPI00371D2C3C
MEDDAHQPRARRGEQQRPDVAADDGPLDSPTGATAGIPVAVHGNHRTADH